MRKCFVSYLVLFFIFSFTTQCCDNSFSIERKQVHTTTKITTLTDTQKVSTFTQESTRSFICNGNKYMVPVAAFVGGVVCGQLGKQVGKSAIDVLQLCLQFLYHS